MALLHRGKGQVWSGKDRRKSGTSNYRGPERREDMRRKKTIERIIHHLERQLD
jgi:hypothetical protein